MVGHLYSSHLHSQIPWSFYVYNSMLTSDQGWILWIIKVLASTPKKPPVHETTEALTLAADLHRKYAGACWHAVSWVQKYCHAQVVCWWRYASVGSFFLLPPKPLLSKTPIHSSIKSQRMALSHFVSNSVPKTWGKDRVMLFTLRNVTAVLGPQATFTELV